VVQKREPRAKPRAREAFSLNTLSLRQRATPRGPKRGPALEGAALNRAVRQRCHGYEG
jgi:hypothetical protein